MLLSTLGNDARPTQREPEGRKLQMKYMQDVPKGCLLLRTILKGELLIDSQDIPPK
jgi:hypothetical protein